MKGSDTARYVNYARTFEQSIFRENEMFSDSTEAVDTFSLTLSYVGLVVPDRRTDRQTDKQTDTHTDQVP